MKPRLSLLLTILLWLTVLGLAAALSLKHDHQWDWTAGQRNTLTPTSRELLQGLPGPIRATAYVFPDADVRRDIRARFAPYLREKPDFVLDFIDPASDPQAVRKLGIEDSGQVLLNYQGRQETLSRLSEPDITAALQRLSQAGDALVAFVVGHGEREPGRDDQSGYSALAELLTGKGVRTLRLPLSTQAIPPQTRLLVLAAPQQQLLPGEIDRLRDYLQSGGNLLWLTDPHLPVIAELYAALQIQPLAGTLIYQDYELLGTGHPALALVADYPDHPVTERLESVTVLPLAGAMRAAGEDWDSRPLLRSVKRAWLETADLQGDLIYNDDADTLGPVTIGLSLQRPRGQQPQRVAVIADSDFASNAYLSQLGNRAFTAALFQWLLARDSQLHIDLPAAPDTSLQLTPLATRGIALGFVVVLPALLAIAGLWRWRRRRRQR